MYIQHVMQHVFYLLILVCNVRCVVIRAHLILIVTDGMISVGLHPGEQKNVDFHRSGAV